MRTRGRLLGHGGQRATVAHDKRPYNWYTSSTCVTKKLERSLTSSSDSLYPSTNRHVMFTILRLPRNARARWPICLSVSNLDGSNVFTRPQTDASSSLLTINMRSTLRHLAENRSSGYTCLLSHSVSWAFTKITLVTASVERFSSATNPRSPPDISIQGASVLVENCVQRLLDL
ncbi:unknown [Antheraea pernyi nucleopolyhedrovirus]|uniref:Uncharacterized protein n=1 Tax=Antheraea pernyi nuclear polyhedrosis virus TaxID=161494 RepID=Q1HH20_NPVAP|nr:hypothetical protein APNV_p078 [Antheraea pernyi nucleopolyhedrovirus]ABF50313.1 unknown [Antheraea pernyi nucleopolyhedrovirus]BAX08850.1 hypothetical protein [Antheraea pernyi nucleopolyhedrovirus]